MTDEFPEEVRQFIGRNISSLAQLELLLFLHRERSRSWDTSEIGRHLSFAPSMSAALLNELLSRGFVSQNADSFQYRCIDAQTDEVVGKLAETYRIRRVAVTNEIYAKPLNRLKSFSDAFRFRKDE
jgi:hypothetical protein